MKWLISFLFVAIAVYYVHAEANLGPSMTGPSTNGPTTSMMWNKRPAYPPIFDSVLSEDDKERLKDIQLNRELSWEERREQIDAVLDKISPSELSKLPLPKGFEKLPNGIYDQIKQIHDDQTMKWSERRQKVRQLMRSLPHEDRRAAFKNMYFPPTPPPGFEQALAPTIYNQLLKIHQSSDLTVQEKKEQFDRVMQQVPQSQLEKLPLPPLMRQLPEETQQRIRSIMHNYKTPWEERHKQVKEYVKALPVELRRLMRPPLPPYVKDLPQEAQNKLKAIHDNDDLEPRERFRKFREVIESLPEEVREKIHKNHW